MDLSDRLAAVFSTLLGIILIWFAVMSIWSVVMIFTNVESKDVAMGTLLVSCLLTIPASIGYGVMVDEIWDTDGFMGVSMYIMMGIEIINFVCTVLVSIGLFIGVQYGVNEDGARVILSQSIADGAFGITIFSIVYSLWTVFIIWGICDIVKYAPWEVVPEIWGIIVVEVMILLYGIAMLVVGVVFNNSPFLTGGSVVVAISGVYVISAIVTFIKKGCL